MRLSMIALPTLLIASGSSAAPIPTRTPVASFPIAPEKAVARIDTTRVDFLPGQEMPEHMHTVPVVCFVSKGRLLVSVGAAPVREVAIGGATIERPGEVVHYFRNASSREAAQLYCAILAGKDDTQVNIMLAK